jgi:DNA-binding LacI/PurR family transcriptional regulator
MPRRSKCTSKPGSRKYAQLVRIIENEYIHNVRYTAAAIPSVRELCERHGVSHLTAYQAVRCLKDAGKLYGEPGRGIFIKRGGGDATQSAVRRVVFLSRPLVGSVATRYEMEIFSGLHAVAAKNEIPLAHLQERDERRCLDALISSGELYKPETGYIFAFESAGIGEAVQQLERDGKPFCVIANGCFPKARTIELDIAAGVRAALEYWIAKGHTRIALANVAIQTRPFDDRTVTFRATLKENRLPVRPEYLMLSDLFHIGVQNGYALTRKLLTLPERPTAILAATDRMAVGALLCLKEMGLSCPKDVAVIGCDNNLDLVDDFIPPIASIDLHATELGRNAFLSLFAPKVPKPVRATFVHRESAG